MVFGWFRRSSDGVARDAVVALYHIGCGAQKNRLDPHIYSMRLLPLLQIRP